MNIIGVLRNIGDYIDDYMPKELVNKMHKIEEPDNEAYAATNKFLEETYSHLEVIAKKLLDAYYCGPEYVTRAN